MAEIYGAKITKCQFLIGTVQHGTKYTLNVTDVEETREREVSIPYRYGAA